MDRIEPLILGLPKSRTVTHNRTAGLGDGSLDGLIQPEVTVRHLWYINITRRLVKLVSQVDCFGWFPMAKN